MRATGFVVMGLAIGFLLQLASDASAQKQPKKKVGAFLKRATADELAAAFAKNPTQSKQEYSPKKAPPGVMAGQIVEISGTVDGFSEGGRVRLNDENSKVRVYLPRSYRNRYKEGQPVKVYVKRLDYYRQGFVVIEPDEEQPGAGAMPKKMPK